MNRLASIIFASLIAIFLRGCAEDEPTSTPEQSAKPSAWHVENGSAVIAVDEEHKDELLAAIREAQSTAEQARSRFNAASAEDRKRWWVKWAASKVDDEIEHVWVQPLVWSPFRIEGVLLSKPTGELACGKSDGDLVSFPVEELTDWIHFTGESAHPSLREPHEGGFTLQALESTFGPP